MANTNKQEVKHEVVYALRHIKTGLLLIMERSSNDGADFCNDSTVRLDIPYGDKPGDWNPDTWFIDTALNAEYVRNFPTEWYNSGERCPLHHFKADELEIVEITRIVKANPVECKIPTFEEYMTLKYGENEPDHCEYVLKQYKESPRSFGSSPYSLWDLMMLVENGGWDPKGDTDGKSDTSRKTRKKKV
jgi:hypothetical protein